MTVTQQRTVAARGRLCRLCRCGSVFIVSDFVGAGGRANSQSSAGAVRLLALSMPVRCGCDEQVPHHPVPRRGTHGRVLGDEAIMDAIAQKAGLEPYEVRLRNMVRPDQMPFDNVVGKHFDSGDHPECLRRAVDAVASESPRTPEATRARRTIDRGRTFILRRAGCPRHVRARRVGPSDRAGLRTGQCRLTADGEVEVHVGTHSHGQGHETTFAQVAHEILTVDFDRIKVYQGDTLHTPYSTATWGSRSMVHGGGAVVTASRILAERAVHIGAWLLQTDPASARIADGKVVAGNSSVTLRDVARTWYLQPQNLPPELDTGGLDVTAGYRATRDSGTFTYAAHAALVAVDPETGVIELLDFVVVEDGGTLVNPMIVDGQICGGAAQGIGTALYEEMPFDSEGQPLASTMIDYLLPGATEVPDIRVLHMETPSPYTEFGIKGLGEGGAVGPPAAIVSAVNDALRPLGVEVYDLPLTPSSVLAAIDRSTAQTKAAAP